MWDILKFILTTIIFAVVIFGGFSLLSRYVFNRVRVNKWIILTGAIIAFVIPLIVPIIFVPMNFYVQMMFSAIFVILILWFFDVNRNGYPKYKKEKKVVIKSKAKPNRAKHANNDKK